MPVPFVGSAGKGGARKRPVARAISLVLPDPLTVGTHQVVIRARGGISRVGWSVFADMPPHYPWYPGGGDNLAVDDKGEVVVTATLNTPGDRIKAFISTGPEARDFSAMAESPKAVAVPSGGSTGGGTGNPAAILAKMGLGINQERFTVNEHANARTPAYYQYYRDLGIRQVRFFIPYREDWFSWSGVTSAANVGPWLEAVQACVDSGMPVTHLDCADVVGPEHMGAAFDDYEAAVAATLAGMNLPADRFIVGAINEYAGATNADWKPHRIRTNGILRAALPNHTIVEGPCTWKDIRALFNPDHIPWAGQPAVGVYEPWADTNTIQDVHHYIHDTADGMQWLADRALQWSRDNNRVVYSGEWGFDTFQNGLDNVAHAADWVVRLDEQTGRASICRMRPTLWCVTNGNAFRMNDPGTNRMTAEMAPAVPRWAARVNAVVSQAPEPPDPPPPAGNTLNVMVRGQSNALLFCDHGGVWTFRSEMQRLTGRTVNIHAAWGDAPNGNYSIFSATAFLDWDTDGQQASLVRFVNGLTTAQKAAPFVTLWMHNEYDQENRNIQGTTTALWVAEVRADAALVRSALGRTAGESPYVFIPIRYPYGGRWGEIEAGINELVVDPTFNATVWYGASTPDIIMDNDGPPNSSHMSWADAHLIGRKLAAELAPRFPGPAS